jgi:hypothetical protein
MKRGDIVITIEYSVDCGQSGISTRHNYAKYKGIAENIKRSIDNHFPFIKSILKANEFDAHDSNIRTAFARSRIGVLDV